MLGLFLILFFGSMLAAFIGWIFLAHRWLNKFTKPGHSAWRWILNGFLASAAALVLIGGGWLAIWTAVCSGINFHP